MATDKGQVLGMHSGMHSEARDMAEIRLQDERIGSSPHRKYALLFPEDGGGPHASRSSRAELGEARDSFCTDSSVLKLVFHRTSDHPATAARSSSKAAEVHLRPVSRVGALPDSRTSNARLRAVAEGDFEITLTTKISDSEALWPWGCQEAHIASLERELREGVAQLAEQHRRKTAPGSECRDLWGARQRPGLVGFRSVFWNILPRMSSMPRQTSKGVSGGPESLSLVCPLACGSQSARLSLALEKMAPRLKLCGFPPKWSQLEVKEQEALLDRQPDSRTLRCKAQHGEGPARLRARLCRHQAQSQQLQEAAQRQLTELTQQAKCKEPRF